RCLVFEQQLPPGLISDIARRDSSEDLVLDVTGVVETGLPPFVLEAHKLIDVQTAEPARAEPAATKSATAAQASRTSNTSRRARDHSASAKVPALVRRAHARPFDNLHVPQPFIDLNDRGYFQSGRIVFLFLIQIGIAEHALKT